MMLRMSLVMVVRHLADAVVQPADAVEAGIDAGDVVPAVHEIRAEHRADVAVGSGDKNFH